MRYLITTNIDKPFFTNNFVSNNQFNDTYNMVVYDFHTLNYTTDGKTWNLIEQDH